MLVNSRLLLEVEMFVLKTQASSKISPFKLLLWIVSLFYKGGVWARNCLYDARVFHVARASLPVVSVGSVVAGGAGKTPLIALLVEKMGPGVAVIARGYRSQSGDVPRAVKESDCSDIVGDEPLLLKRRYPEAIVIVAKNRYDGVEYARALGAKFVILDDGMQHRRLYRDIEVAIADNTAKRNYYLPRGMLRDDPRRLNRADYLFCRGESSSGGIGIELKIESFENSSGEIFTGKRVGLFCTIARPYRFIESAEKCGLIVDMKWLLPDHCLIDEERLEKFVSECKQMGLDGVVCTEKDWVKLSHKALELPIYYAKARMRITYGHGHFDRLIAQMTEMI